MMRERGNKSPTEEMDSISLQIWTIQLSYSYKNIALSTSLVSTPTLICPFSFARVALFRGFPRSDPCCGCCCCWWCCRRCNWSDPRWACWSHLAAVSTRTTTTLTLSTIYPSSFCSCRSYCCCSCCSWWWYWYCGDPYTGWRSIPGTTVTARTHSLSFSYAYSVTGWTGGHRFKDRFH